VAEKTISHKPFVIKMEAVVFGLFETGLGVIRSLGREGINVIGVDFKKDIAWFSHYVKPIKCPHPLQNEQEFIEWVTLNFSKDQIIRPVFFTSDDFLISFSRNREIFAKYFLFNLISHSLLEKIMNKYCQFQLAVKAGIELPATYPIKNTKELDEIKEKLNYPIFIKGQNVNSWRKNISGSIKGFLANDWQELQNRVSKIIKKDVTIILQEVILGPDTNHYKYCSYTSGSGETLAEFTLQKIRQNPIHFGVGAVVESICDQELLETGRKLFRNIGYKGIGSAEFKRDDRDGKLKLIEINPRYWQQNSLSTACGMNFPFLNYLDLLLKEPEPLSSFKTGIKWVNRYMDFDSFLKYRKEGALIYSAWRKSLKGKKIYSDFTWNDPIPAFHEIGFGWKLIKSPWFIWKRLKK
jgi:D-aspartate ligase